MTGQGQKRRRGGGRAGNALRRGSGSIEQMPWHLPINNDSPTEPLNEEGIIAIHEGAMRILEEIGVEFLNEKALSIMKKAGCKVCLLYTSPSPRDAHESRMPSSA